MRTIDPALLHDDYHSILHRGLANLQNAGLPELHDYLRIEIDHLHNLPSYMRSDNVFRHAYYYCEERTFYLERVVAVPVIDVDMIISLYTPHWDAIRASLMPYADVINAHNRDSPGAEIL